MTAEEEYLNEHGIPNMPTQLSKEYQTEIKDTALALKDYHKEASKELVEALKSVTEGYKHYSTLLNKHDWKRIHKAEKALENHLKKN